MVNQEKLMFRVIGNVTSFGQVIGKIDGVTWAVSRAKAKNNMVYRYKLSHGLTADSKVGFSGIAEQIY